MKKCLALLFFSVMVCLSGYAQKGRQGVGLTGGVGYFNDAQGFGWCGGLKYEHFLTNYIRLAPCLEYHRNHFYGDYSTDAFSIKAKSDFFLFSADTKVRPYAHAGIGYVTGNYEFSYHEMWGVSNLGSYEEDLKAFNVRAGFGLDWRISYAMSVQFEVAYDCAMGEEYEEGYGHIDFGVGLTYYFK